MAKSKLTGKQRRLSSPFDATAHKVERSAVGVLMHWMREIIKSEGLDLGLPDVDTTGADRKSPDIVINETRRSKNVLCVIEAKPTYFDVFDEKNLKEPARLKASRRKAKYFATTNFKYLIWYSTERVNALAPEEQQVVDKYHLSELEDLDSLEEARYREPIQKGLKSFLLRLYAVNTDKEAEPKLAIDEWLVFRLHEKIGNLTRYYRPLIEDHCHKEAAFCKSLAAWFNEQGWSFAWQAQDFDKAARQTAYLLINKILFYNLLQAKRPDRLDPLEIPRSLTKGQLLQSHLQGFFNEVLGIDYETIYTTDFIDSLAFPDKKEVVKEIKDCISILRYYDFSTLGYDVIGRIFESIIPQNERHNLGQYFTSPDVVDIILSFCMTHETDQILDPACGAGTFLVRAYQHKKMLNQRLDHETLLKSLWGTDIAKFPAHLATINLAINDLSVDRNYPNILQEDFFTLLSTQDGLELPNSWRKARASTLGIEKRFVEYPRYFDCVVGNPPYTRQEEISEISEKDTAYKRKVIERALLDLRGKKLADIGKRAGIHAYFFVHGYKFLRDGGRFGFIVSDSWMDADYGKGIQEFFLKNYKIVAVIESKVERWFAEADVNTCIIILERCKDEEARKENLVRFMYLKKPLRHFIPAAQDMWEKENIRLEEIDRLKKTIIRHREFYENEDFRVFPKSQWELYEEGYDIEKKKYIGAKWGKYLRAPDIFFKVLKKGKGKFVQLKDVAKVSYGIKSGANKFFYLKEEEIKQRGIEKQFWMHKDEENKWIPNYILTSPQNSDTIIIKCADLENRVLLIKGDNNELKDKMVLKYINYGEQKGFHKHKTCSVRNVWYKLDEIGGKLFWIKDARLRLPVFFSEKAIFCDCRLYTIVPKQNNYKVLAGILNSTVEILLAEFIGRELGGGGGPRDVMTYETAQLLTINPNVLSPRIISKLTKAFDKLSSRPIHTIFEEIGEGDPSKVNIETVRPDRRELDNIIMGEVLALSEEEQLEVYRAVVDLVKSRIEKAQSTKKHKRTKDGIDLDALVKTIIDKLGVKTIGNYYRERVLSSKNLLTMQFPKPGDKFKVEEDLFGWKVISENATMECRSEEEARYLAVLFSAGLTTVKVPKSDNTIKSLLSELEALKTKTDKVINSYLESIVDSKTRYQIAHCVWSEIMK